MKKQAFMVVKDIFKVIDYSIYTFYGSISKVLILWNNI